MGMRRMAQPQREIAQVKMIEWMVQDFFEARMDGSGSILFILLTIAPAM